MVSRVMEWRDRLIEKGLDEEIADELVVGLPEQLAGADDVRALKRGLERVEATLGKLQVDVGGIDQRLKTVEQAVVDLRGELRAMRQDLMAQLENERVERRFNIRVMLTVVVLAMGANAGIVAAIVELLS